MYKFLKKENGITLIALVITIIVLLILAGVSIVMLTGENGILTQAQKAKNETEEARIEEENTLTSYENYMYEVMEDVPKVNDDNPGILEGSGTEEEPFIINSIEDLVVFSDNVTKGINNYEGQYVELGISLDFNSDKSYVNPNREDYVQYGYNGKLKEMLNVSGFIPIGTAEYSFSNGVAEDGNLFYGNFDGKGFAIYNLKLKQEKEVNDDTAIILGMFSKNYGIIQNLYIKQANASIIINGGKKYLEVGILVGENKGMIIDCYTSGEISVSRTEWACSVGGIVGANVGEIKQCYNIANINVEYSCKENRIGGIVGGNELTGQVENSYNKGNIRTQVFDNQSGEDDLCLIGGIVGRNMGNIKNGYSIGKIDNVNNESVRIFIDAIGANHVEGQGEIDNCYYIEDIVHASGINTEITENGEVKTKTQMKSKEFLDLLNQDNSGIWKFSSGKNDGYPVLYWE